MLISMKKSLLVLLGISILFSCTLNGVYQLETKYHEMEAKPIGPHSIVKLDYSVNHLDFNNDGFNDVVILARRENFYAYGFDVVSFYSEEPRDGSVIEVSSDDAPASSLHGVDAPASSLFIFLILNSFLYS